MSVLRNEKISVLYIDDEKHNLSSFRAVFRRDFEVHLAENTDEGLELLKTNDIQVLITDQRMPGLTGVEFLESIKDTFPDPIRMLLTGYSDITAVIDAINKGGVYRYITKPWNEKELKIAINNAYELYCLRRENNFFIHKVSHDLRGPIASMGGLLNLFKLENLSEQVEQYVSLMDYCMENLNKHVDGLIDYKKIGQATLKHSFIQFESLIEEIMPSLKVMREYSGINIIVDIDQSIEFKSDRGLVRSIIANLMNNAVRYRKTSMREESQVLLQILVEETKVKIKIKDNGEGMPPDILSNIFKVFYKSTEKKTGNGIGLYIVRTAIDKLGGKIEANSIEGIGTELNIELPNLTGLY